MNKLTGTILTLPKMSGNVGAKTINIGGKGDDGATFTPSVSADGIISWTNDKDLPNPEPVNIKGTKGDKGDKGDRGLQGVQGIQGERGEQGQKGDKGDRGEQGIQGIQGAKGETGAQGQKGADGTPATHRWSGTTLYITSASGTSSADLKGEKGDRGEKGDKGADGAHGKPGKDGADGKSAYAYAQDAGYTGTESEFAEKLASESSGIHVGPDAPTDKNINVWIDTDEEPEEVPGTGSGIDVTAEVGQTIIVEEVDENGKPTKWKAVDFPEGGSSAPADWNANEGEPGHVLNRTHCKNWVNVIPTREMMDDGDGMFILELTADMDPFCLHRVNYNGAIYECMPAISTYDNNVKLSFAMGNLAMVELGEDTGEPFVIAVGDGVVILMPLDGATSVTISIDEYKTEELSKDYYTSTYFIDVVETDGVYTTDTTYIDVLKAGKKGCNIVVRCGYFIYQHTFGDLNIPTPLMFCCVRQNKTVDFLTLSITPEQLENLSNAVYSCEYKNVMFG